MVDTLGSGSSVRADMLVRVQFWAANSLLCKELFFYKISILLKADFYVKKCLKSASNSKLQNSY